MSLATLLTTLGELKRQKRTGWLDRGVPPAAVESVADHSLLTAITAYVVACDASDLRTDRVLALAVVHDLVEAITGDPPPYGADDVPADPVARRAFFRVRHPRSAESRAAKQQAEAAAMAQLLAQMPPGAASTFRALWEEYEERATPEARFVKEVDLLEAFLQSRRYAEQFPELPFDGFRLQALEELTHPALCAIRDEVLSRPRPQPEPPSPLAGGDR